MSTSDSSSTQKNPSIMKPENASLQEQELREKFTHELALVSWSTLYPHIERQAVFWVDPQADLIQVGLAIALDRLDEVQTYLQSSVLQKAGSTPLVSDQGITALGYKFLIVQPYVIASPVYLPE